MKRWLILAAVLSLSACGGGGSSGSPSGRSPGSADPEEPTPAAGLWEGTHRIDGTTTDQPIVVLVTEEGDFAALGIGSGMLFNLFGTASMDEDSFSADPAAYMNFSPTEASVEATVVEGISLDGSFTIGGLSSEFMLNYWNIYNRTGSISKLQGVYSYEDLGEAVVVEANGTLTATMFSGCVLTGTVRVPNPARNYYRLTGTASSCGTDNGPISGLIYLADSEPGRSEDLLVLLAHTDSHSTSFATAPRR